jgi:hypothetical protein
MTHQQVIEYLRSVLAKAANGSGGTPRPEGDFVGSATSRPISGLRLATPDGATFYLAVVEADSFEEGGSASGGGRRLEPGELIEIVIGTAAADDQGVTARELSDKFDSWGIAVSREDAEALLAGLAQTGRIDKAADGRYKGV